VTYPTDVLAGPARPASTRIVTCRYLGKRDVQCTAEAVDPDGALLICAHHLGRALEMVKERTGSLRKALR
jgi:hypothetical protein